MASEHVGRDDLHSAREAAHRIPARGVELRAVGHRPHHECRLDAQAHERVLEERAREAPLRELDA